MTSTVEVTLVTETIGIALGATRSQIAALPDPAQPDYPARVAAVTSDLARPRAVGRQRFPQFDRDGSRSG